MPNPPCKDSRLETVIANLNGAISDLEDLIGNLTTLEQRTQAGVVLEQLLTARQAAQGEGEP